MKSLKIMMVGLLAAWVGCDSGGGTSDPFVGHWSCMGVDTTTYTMPAGMAPLTENTAATVAITDDGHGNLTIVRTPANGAPMCTIMATLGADKMSFSYQPNQMCMTKNGVTQTFTMHLSTKTASGYSATSAWTLSGMNTAGATVAATGTGSSSCTPM
jgi:hypothetical protein